MTLKVLLVGCGEHSAENLIPSLKAISEVHVAGLCDPDAMALESAARWFPDAATSSKIQLSSQDIDPFDVLVVAGPPMLHEHIARLAIESGKPVFVEKPPAVHTAQLIELAEAAKAKRLITCVGHNLRHSDAAVQLRSAVVQPGFGSPVAMEMRYLASKPRGVRWGLESPLRSFLLSHANHAIDLMIYQMGDLREVVAARAHPELDGGIAIAAQFVFTSGAVGSLLATSYSPHFMVSATIVSGSGALASMTDLRGVEVLDDHPMGKRWGNAWRPRTLETGFRFAGYQTELERFFAAVVNDTPELVHPSFDDEVAIYRAMDAIERSVERGGI